MQKKVYIYIILRFYSYREMAREKWRISKKGIINNETQTYIYYYLTITLIILEIEICLFDHIATQA